MDQHSQIKKILNVILFTRTKEKRIKMMNNDMNVSEKQNRIVEQMSSISILPIKDESIMEDDNYTKIPYMSFLALGTGLEPVANLLQKAILGNDQSGLYWVRVPKGHHLARRRDGSGLIGAALCNDTNQVAGQAILNNVTSLDPTTLYIIATLYAINYKLDAINQGQKDIQSFLEQKEHSELQGSLLFLTDVINNYKYNWNNDFYLKNNHLKALDIKEMAEQKIDFYQSQIRKETSKKEFLLMDKDVKKKLDVIKNDLINYQLAFYLLSFASLLEVILSESFDSCYIQSVIHKLSHYSLEYRQLYTECYEIIEKNVKNSVESQTIKGISTISQVMGKTIEKAPLLGKTPIDESLISASDKLIALNNDHTEALMKELIQNQGGFVKPFIDTLTSMKKYIVKIYNSQLMINIFISIRI